LTNAKRFNENPHFHCKKKTMVISEVNKDEASEPCLSRFYFLLT